jgi:23S rRNA (adenine-C8)-methyltransferase
MTATKYDRIRELLLREGGRHYRYEQFTSAVFSQRIARFRDVLTLPKRLRDALAEEFGEGVCDLRIAARVRAEQATKLLFVLRDGQRVETVQLRYRRGWESVCISSQAGCGLRCAFCATGRVGLRRNLTADEITDQVLGLHLSGSSLDSVSFMGMGEALANPHTFDALRVLTDRRLFALSPRRITVSTVGVVPALRRLVTDFPQVPVTFSLHSPFDEERDVLVPLNRVHPTADVLGVLDGHIRRHGRKVYLAYTLLAEVNDTSRMPRRWRGSSASGATRRPVTTSTSSPTTASRAAASTTRRARRACAPSGTRWPAPASR